MTATSTTMSVSEPPTTEVANTSRAASPRGAMLWLAELALFLCTAAAEFGLARVFVGWAFLRPLLVTALVAHGCCLVLRRLHVPWFLALPLEVLAGWIALGWYLYPATLRYRLPTGLTSQAARTDVADAVEQFSSAVPPVDAKAGFVLAAMAATWLIAVVADTIAFRMQSAVEAVLPSGVMFVFCSILGVNRYRLTSTLAWMAAALTFVMLLRTLTAMHDRGWLTNHRRGAAVTYTRVGVLLGTTATILGAWVGPRLPGSHDQALIKTHNAGSSTVFAISPLVDIRKRLASRSTVELFTVKSSVRSYWRATSLPDFDGSQWSSDLRQSKATGTLSKAAAGVPQIEIDASFAIGALGDIWMPAPFQPVSLTATDIAGSPRYDRDTGTLMIPKLLSSGDRYTVVAQTPDVDAARLRTAAPPKVDKRYLALPADYPDTLRDVAASVVKDAATNFDKAKAIQDWFQTEFVYDLNVEPGQANNDIEDFLRSRRGYCEQFSGTFAAFARSLGIPARVAVGFTPGTLESDGLYHVKALHAHAWPEVYFEGFGWLSFEPTPGRGNPTATTYTGVTPQQAGEEAPVPTTTVAPPSTISPASTTPTSAPTAVEETPAQLPKTPTAPWWSRYRVALGILGALAVIGSYPFAVRRLHQRRWRKRRLAAGHPADRLAVTWHRALDVLSGHHFPPKTGETPQEFAARATSGLRLPDNALTGLADAVTRATYGGEQADDRVLRDAERVPLQTATILNRRLSTRRRCARALDPRPVVRPLPGDNPRQRRFG